MKARSTFLAICLILGLALLILYAKKSEEQVFESIPMPYPLQNADSISSDTENDVRPLSKPDSLLERAREFVEIAQYDSAEVYARKAYNIYSEAGHSRGITRSVYLQVDAFERAGEYENAYDLLQDYIPKSRTWLGDADLDYAALVHKMGLVLRNLENEVAALEKYTEALRIRRGHMNLVPLDVAQSLNNIGSIHLDRGQYDEALRYYQEALAIRRKFLDENHREIAQNYNNIGIIYKNTGDYGKALEYHHRALSIRQDVLGLNHHEVGDSYYNIGVVFGMMNEPDPALLFHKQSLNVWQKNLGEHHPLIQINMTAIGLDYQKKKQYGKALEYEQKSLELLRKYAEINSPRFEVSLSSLGALHMRLNKYKEARIYLQDAIENALHNWGDKHPSLARSYNELAKLSINFKEYEKALDYVFEAIDANYEYKSIYSERVPEELTNYLSINQLLSSLLLRASIYFERAFSQEGEGKFSDLKASIEASRQLINIVDEYRRSFRAESSKLFLAEQMSSMFSQAIAAATLLYEATGDEQYLNEIFIFMEKSKANVLLDALNEADARRFARIPDSLLAKEKKMRSDLAYYDKKLKREQFKGPGADSTLSRHWQTLLFDQGQQYDELVKTIETEYEEYYNLKYKSVQPTLKEIKSKLLTKDDALIEYFVGQDSIFVFAVTQEEMKLTHTPRILLNDRIDSLRSAIKNQNIESFTQYSHSLYETLVSPVKEVVDDKLNWIMVPHENLNYIPFEALLTNKPYGDDVGFSDLSYVVLDHNVQYLYSSTIEINNRKSSNSSGIVAKNTWEKDFIGFAPVFKDGMSREMLGEDVINSLTRSMPPLKFTVGSKKIFWPSVEIDSDTTQTEADTLLAIYLSWLTYLPSSKDEIKGIHNMFGSKYNAIDRFVRKKSMIKLNKKASEATLKSLDLKKFRYIHFATHGILDETLPEISGIIMAQDTTGGEDGILQLKEIYNLDLSADLVVLSACDTGLGKLAQGEGIVGLTGGFMYAGARSLAVSLWKVSDVSTKILMNNFYDHLSDNVSKTNALRQAKIEMIMENTRRSSPFHWAGFILIGGVNDEQQKNDRELIL